MSLSWDRIDKMIDRYERLCNENLKEMATLQRALFDATTSKDICKRHNYSQQRTQLNRIEDQVLSGFRQLLAIRPEIEEPLQEKFDLRTEPIRKKIQSCVQANSKLPDEISTEIARRQDEESESAELNPYEEEMIRHSKQIDNAHVESLKQVAKDAQEKAAATAKLQQDMQDLEQIFAELNRIVHEQHDIIDSIEDHVEKSATNIDRGNKELKKAIAHKAAKAPIVAATVGGLAIGGPVGIAAGSVLAGVVAGESIPEDGSRTL
ncbi:hypothetical protein WR25_08262 [Diploscapter pachys]|uniref:t-SNARE coiled-coil homology domain-containing protein n=1 Tax=Diploscapter pachys TaxID=2018661 RepID=A0A2A2LHE0_9BILA|nr:hypothetical protein WR25_08262 [Diploscapter pachys]